MEKNNSLMSGKGEKGKWITVNGSHIFIEDGQSVEDAMNKQFSKSTKNEESSDAYIEKNSANMKKALKDKGFDTKKISIRQRDSGYSTAFDVKIKDPTIDKDEVEKVCKKFQEYDRDYATGEILEGGNTYVFVDYEHGLFDEVAKPYEDAAKKYISQAQEIPEGHSVSIQDGVYLIKDRNWFEIYVHNDKQYTRSRIVEEKELAKKLYQINTFGKMV